MKTTTATKKMENSEYSNLTVAQINQRLQQALSTTAEAIETVCQLLYELASRGENHQLMRDGVFRWYREISTGQLSPQAVFAFAGVSTILSRLIGFPITKQERIALGEPIPVVEMNATRTNVLRVEKPIIQLSTAALDIAFEAPGKLRSVTAQEKIVRNVSPPSRREPTPIFIAHPDTGEITCGGMRFKPALLEKPLAKLGLKIVAIQ